MKQFFLLLLPLLMTRTLPAQLVITPGAQLFMLGNAQVTLQNTNLVNNGTLTAGNSMFSFTGNANSTIGGSQFINFFACEVNKTSNSAVSLQSPINISSRILFTNGFLNLNGFNADLGNTAFLDGEKESSRVTGSNGGQVLFNTTLNAPVAANPGNLGAVISSGQNLGNVVIRRGHQSQLNSTGTGASILRFYDIVPANNTGLNATLRFNYFDGELNNLNENLLVLVESKDTLHWNSRAFTTRSTAVNFVEKTALNSFARFTLSADNNPLPVRFVSFNTKCESNRVIITWKTAQEQNSSHFNIEKSLDGSNWSVIGSRQAAGSSTTSGDYSFTDNNPVQNSFYRIAQYDADGSFQYTGVVKSSCSIADALNVWPNPFHNTVFVNITAAGPSQAVIKIFDSKGALLKIDRASVVPGTNQFGVDIASFANGVYQLSVEWGNGQKKIIPVMKQ
jgi:hypothetical protein